MTILFSGMIAGDPHQGGATWAVLQYVLGLRRLGHRVIFIEPIKSSSLRSAGTTLEESQNAAYFHRVVREFGLEEHAALLLQDTRATIGLRHEQLLGLARKADLLINISGMLTDSEILEPVPRRVYLDLDPAFVQLWHSQGVDMRFSAHTHFVTVGQCIGQSECPIPTCGRQWVTTLQPIVLWAWPVATEVQHDALTTIGNWRGYGSVESDGVHYGQKAHSLRRFMELPKLTSERFLLAMSIHAEERADLAALERNGWELLDPQTVAGTPADYQRFIQGSKAEFGIAKSGYVASRCGWFSDRSVAYLASGRPVIAQNTGFDAHLPTGRGLFAFDSTEEVLHAIEQLNADYAGHARAARDIAETHFNSDIVLPRLLEKVGAL